MFLKISPLRILYIDYIISPTHPDVNSNIYDKIYHYYRKVQKQIAMLDNGEIPEETEVINLITDAHRALEECEGKEIHEKIYLHETAFFRGFLGLTEEESLFIEPDEDGEYGILFSDDERVSVAVEAILDKCWEVRE